MGIGIIGFDTKPVEIFHYIDFRTQVTGRTKVHRFIISILSFINQPVFYRIIQFLIEHSHHKLFRRAWEKFITHIDVVGYRMFQIGISFFLVVLIDDAVRNNFEETGPIDGTCIRKTQVRILVYIVFGVKTRQDISIFLVAFRVYITGKFQYISLIGMFHTHPGNEFPFTIRILHHPISRPDAFGRIVVQRITYVSIRTRCKKYFIEIIPVFTQVLRILTSGSRIKSIFIEETVTFLIAIHTTDREIECPVCGIL